MSCGSVELRERLLSAIGHEIHLLERQYDVIANSLIPEDIGVCKVCFGDVCVAACGKG